MPGITGDEMMRAHRLVRALARLSCLSVLACSQPPDKFSSSAPPVAAQLGGVAVLVPAPEARFAPARVDARDVGLGEVRRYRVRLEAGGAGLKGSRLVSSCDCLSARFLSEPDGNGATVEVTVDGFKEESISGLITLESSDRTVLAEHQVEIDVALRPFVEPREVFLSAPYQGEFSIYIGKAYPLAESNPGFEVDMPEFDESRFALIDFQDEPKLLEEHLVKRTRWTFARLQEAGKPESGEKFTMKLLEPEYSVPVPVRTAPEKP